MLFNAFSPHEHWAYELNKESKQQAGPVDQVQEYLEVVYESCYDPREQDAREVRARGVTETSVEDELFCECRLFNH